MEHNPSPIILLCTYVGFYIALVQSKTVRSSDLAKILPKLNVQNSRQFLFDTKKRDTKKIELEELVNLRYFSGKSNTNK
jgi:hypothetical protein